MGEFTLKKYLISGLIFLLAGIIIILGAFMLFDNENSKNIKFLKSYGWEVEKKPVEQAEINIPAVFDDIYENYNILQAEAGLDLSPYAGMKAKRYTYILKNFPYDTDEQVRANVITVNKEPVAGDIMTVSLGGFMYSLNFNEAVCFAIK